MLETMRILVVEDDKKIASFVVNGLKQSGFAVDHSGDGENGLIMAQSIAYDAAVVDLMLPKLDGLSLIQQLRVEFGDLQEFEFGQLLLQKLVFGGRLGVVLFVSHGVPPGWGLGLGLGTTRHRFRDRVLRDRCPRSVPVVED